MGSGGERGEVEVGAGEDRLDPAEAFDPGPLIGEGAPVGRVGVHDPVELVIDASLDVGRLGPAGEVVLLEGIGREIE